MLKIRLVCKPFTIYTVKYREIWPRTSFNLPPIDSHSLKLIRVKFKLLYILIIFIYTFLFAEEVKYLLLEFATANNYICNIFEMPTGCILTMLSEMFEYSLNRISKSQHIWTCSVIYRVFVRLQLVPSTHVWGRNF